MNIIPQHQEDVDQARLSALLDKLCPAAKKFAKAEHEAFEHGIVKHDLNEAKDAVLGLLFSLDADLEWLTRVKAAHAEDVTGRQLKRQMFKNKK